MLIKPLFFTKSKTCNSAIIRLAFWAFFCMVPLHCSERKRTFDPDSLVARASEGIPVRHFYLYPHKASLNQSSKSYTPGKPVPSSFSIEPEPAKQPASNPMHIDLSADDTVSSGSTESTPPSFIASPSVSPEQAKSRKRTAELEQARIQKRLKSLVTQTTKLQQELDKVNKKHADEKSELSVQCQTLATDQDKVHSQLTVTDQNVLQLTQAFYILSTSHDKVGGQVTITDQNMQQLTQAFYGLATAHEELKVKHFEFKQGCEAVVGKMAVDVLKIVQGMQGRIQTLEQQAAQVAPLQNTVAELALRLKNFSPDFQLPPLFPALQTQSLGVEEDL